MLTLLVAFAPLGTSKAPISTIAGFEALDILTLPSKSCVIPAGIAELSPALIAGELVDILKLPLFSFINKGSVR